MFAAPTDAPLPDPSPDVAVTLDTTTTNTTVYVLQFGGWARTSVALANAARLALAVQRDGLPLRADGSFSLALYDGRRIFQRHNEVWLYAQ